MNDPLRAHYAVVVREIERVILDRVPKVPLVPAPRPLDADSVTRLAGLLAQGHDIAATLNSESRVDRDGATR